MGYKHTKETIYRETECKKQKRAYHIGKLSSVTNKHTWKLEVTLRISIYKGDKSANEFGIFEPSDN